MDSGAWWATGKVGREEGTQALESREVHPVSWNGNSSIISHVFYLLCQLRKTDTFTRECAIFFLSDVNLKRSLISLDQSMCRPDSKTVWELSNQNREIKPNLTYLGQTLLRVSRQQFVWFSPMRCLSDPLPFKCILLKSLVFPQVSFLHL